MAAMSEEATVASGRHACLTPYLDVHPYGIGDLLHEQARSRPHHPAVIDGAHRFTYRQLDERVNRLATVLRDHGVERGDRILWLGQNSFRVMEVLLASARTGAIVCPVNWRASREELSWTVEDFDPKIIFWQDAEIGDTSRETRMSWQEGRFWIQHDSGDPGDLHSYEELIARADPLTVFEPVEISVPLLAIYTAAFSGKPGAALLSHESLLIMSMLAMQGQALTENSGHLVSGPMFHVGVLMGTLGCFMAGGRNAFVARVRAEELLEMIEREKLTHGYIPQPTSEQMRELNRDGRYDISSMFERSDLADWTSTTQMPKHAPQQQRPGGYGQTEMGGLVVLGWMGGAGAGRPAPYLQVKIGDEQGNELPDGETGEIFARGPLVMCGYWNRPEENARRVVNGWHRSNDLGKRLDDGSIVFVGPKTTMIKTGVENVYPAEVEACIRTMEGVSDVCIIGVPDPTWDQNVKAIVIRAEGHDDLTAEHIIDHCRARLASYKKPKIVTFVDTLPRTPIGFVDRAAVDAAYGGGGYPKYG